MSVEPVEYLLRIKWLVCVMIQFCFRYFFGDGTFSYLCSRLGVHVNLVGTL